MKLSRLLVEALVVGIGLVVLFYVVKVLSGCLPLPILVFMAGALFHILCEKVGANTWYCGNRPECR